MTKDWQMKQQSILLMKQLQVILLKVLISQIIALILKMKALMKEVMLREGMMVKKERVKILSFNNLYSILLLYIIHVQQ